MSLEKMKKKYIQFLNYFYDEICFICLLVKVDIEILIRLREKKINQKSCRMFEFKI